MEKKYQEIRHWQKAPTEYSGLSLQTGEILLVRKNGRRFILTMSSGELKIHPYIEGGKLRGLRFPFGKKLLKYEVYPPVSDWGSAPKEFSWLQEALRDGEYSIQVGEDFSTFIIAKWQGALKAHLRILFTEMPPKWRYVRREKYPPFHKWRAFHAQDVPLKMGEYTILVNSRTWTGAYILAKLDNNVVLGYPYLEGAIFSSDLKFVPYGEIESRK